MKGVFKMNNTNKTNCHTISGIKCEVKNCKYHDGSHCCEAGCIEVSPYCLSKASLRANVPSN